MTRRTAAAVAAIALAVPVALWLAAGPGAPGRPSAADIPLADLMRDLGITPATGPAKAFRLESLEGRPVALADFKGRPVLLYFWATW